MNERDLIYIYVVARRASQGKADPKKAVELIFNRLKKITDR